MNWHLLECSHYASNTDVLLFVEDGKPTGKADCRTCTVPRRIVKKQVEITNTTVSNVSAANIKAAQRYIDRRYGSLA